MTENDSGALVDRYYNAERLTIIISLVLIFYQVFGLDEFTSIPVIDVKLREPAQFPFAATIVLVIALAFTIIEWMQSSGVARHKFIFRIRLAITLAFAYVATWLNYPALIKDTPFSTIPWLWVLCYTSIGFGIGALLSVLILSTLMIRSAEQARQTDLPRIPVAAQRQYIIWGPIIFALIISVFVANHYSPKELLPLVPFLIGIPALIPLISLIANLFFHHDINGKRLSFSKRISLLKEAFHTHDYMYYLAEEGGKAATELSIPKNEKPFKLQRSIREAFAIDRRPIDFRAETLKEISMRIMTVDGNPANQSPENIVVKIETSDSSDEYVPVCIFIPELNEKKELLVKKNIIEKHATNYLRNNAEREIHQQEYFSYSINQAVIETIEAEFKTPLHAAATSGRQETLETYLAKGHDINERDASGWTPLLHAVAQGYASMVQFILEKGANPDISNYLGITPIMYAARYGNTNIAKQLLDFGAKLELKDKYGDTALAVAVRNGHKAIVELLLSKGASINNKNIEGLTPLDIAYKEKQGKIARLLRKQIAG